MSNPNLPAQPAATDTDITAALRDSGLLESSGGTEFHRIKVQNGIFYADDEIVGQTDVKNNTPAFLAQIVQAPEEYQAKWFPAADDYDNGGNALALAVGRPEIAGKMCRSHFDKPEEAREYAEDGTKCRTCPVNPFQKRDLLPPEARGQKCAWRGDLDLRIVETAEDGSYAISDETVYTISLPFTAMVEFKGMGNKEPMKGSVSDLNFMQRLARLAITQWPELEAYAAISKARQTLMRGGVIAEVRSIPTQNPHNGNRYSVTQFIPVALVPTEEPAAELESSDSAAADGDDESVPF